MSDTFKDSTNKTSNVDCSMPRLKKVKEGRKRKYCPICNHDKFAYLKLSNHLAVCHGIPSGDYRKQLIKSAKSAGRFKSVRTIFATCPS